MLSKKYFILRQYGRNCKRTDDKSFLSKIIKSIISHELSSKERAGNVIDISFLNITNAWKRLYAIKKQKKLARTDHRLKIKLKLRSDDS